MDNSPLEVAVNSGSYGIVPRAGYCQTWVAAVYSKAGLTKSGACCAYHAGTIWGTNPDWNSIPVGATVYGYSNSKYGHVGIYVGNGLVYPNIGRVAVDTLEQLVTTYRGFGWGWESGHVLTDENGATNGKPAAIGCS